MARLTTHVLDLHGGRPAAGMRVELHRLDGDRRVLGTFLTDAAGRSDGALLEGERFRSGSYELVYHAGAYFASRGIETGTPPFLDEIIARFGVANARDHYHVALLVTPWSYTLYRGS